jgi:3-oxoacyl-[acyl-carrier protein] reductase
MRLSGKVAVITGGSRGIGKAIALAFAREGARIAVAARNQANCEEVVSQIVELGGEAVGIQTDVSSESEVARLAAQTVKRFQRVDILVNAAAVNLPYRKVTDLTLKEWNWVLGVNLTGTFLTCRSILPTMIEQGSGKIINFSSVGGRVGAAGRSPYRASKAAIINFTECLAAEVKEFGIGVNAICPGAVKTDMLREITGNEVPAYALDTADITPIALFLASDDSRALTGTAIDAFGLGSPIFGITSSVRPKK